MTHCQRDSLSRGDRRCACRSTAVMASANRGLLSPARGGIAL